MNGRGGRIRKALAASGYACAGLVFAAALCTRGRLCPSWIRANLDLAWGVAAAWGLLCLFGARVCRLRNDPEQAYALMRAAAAAFLAALAVSLLMWRAGA